MTCTAPRKELLSGSIVGDPDRNGIQRRRVGTLEKVEE